MPTLSVREMRAADLPALIDYWLNAKPDFLRGMGVDAEKIPTQSEWETMLSAQLRQPIPEKNSYCIIWEADGQAVGHSNINKIILGEEAYMHLHLWPSTLRQSGMGLQLVRLTLPYFFDFFHLKKLYCEPYALNHAPNKTLAKVGFELVSTQVNTPGWLNFEQPTCLWMLSAERFAAMR